jgi:hypothetical protein
MSVVITIVVIVLLAAGVYGFVRTARFGTSFLTKGSGFKAADIYDRYADKPRRRDDEDAASQSRDST